MGALLGAAPSFQSQPSAGTPASLRASPVVFECISKPSDTRELGFSTRGTISDVLVKPGDTVKAVVTVTDLVRDKRRAVLKTVCSVGNRIVVDGEALVKTTSRADRA